MAIPQKDAFVNVSNSRPGTYEEVIRQIEKDKVCPFCPDQLKKYHKNPILAETPRWIVTTNMYPYKGAKTHALFIHKEHIVGLQELSADAWKEFHELIAQFISERKIPGGTALMRFGDTKYTGASVNHLHAHLISSDPDQKDYAPVLARVG